MDLHHAIKVTNAIPPAAATTDNTPWVSTILDCANFDANELILTPGSLADADATFTVLLEEGAQSNLSDHTAVVDEDLLGLEATASFTFSDDNGAFKLGYKGNKRYIRATITPANNTGNAFLSAAWVQAGARVQPRAG
jgi:hypothetical protein